MAQSSRQHLSDLEIDERSSAAQSFLNDPVIAEALADLQKSYMGTLMSSDVGSPEAASAHAGMKVLEDFKASLLAMITDKKMRIKYGSKTDVG